MKKKKNNPIDNQLKLKINLNTLSIFDDKCGHLNNSHRFQCCSNHSGNNYFSNFKQNWNQNNKNEQPKKNNKILMKSKDNSSLKLKIFASKLLETNFNPALTFNDQNSNIKSKLFQLQKTNHSQIEPNSLRKDCKFVLF